MVGCVSESTKSVQQAEVPNLDGAVAEGEVQPSVEVAPLEIKTIAVPLVTELPPLESFSRHHLSGEPALLPALAGAMASSNLSKKVTFRMDSDAPNLVCDELEKTLKNMEEMFHCLITNYESVSAARVS